MVRALFLILAALGAVPAAAAAEGDFLVIAHRGAVIEYLGDVRQLMLESVDAVWERRQHLLPLG